MNRKVSLSQLILVIKYLSSPNKDFFWFCFFFYLIIVILKNAHVEQSRSSWLVNYTVEEIWYSSAFMSERPFWVILFYVIFQERSNIFMPITGRKLFSFWPDSTLLQVCGFAGIFLEIFSNSFLALYRRRRKFGDKLVDKISEAPILSRK